MIMLYTSKAYSHCGAFSLLSGPVFSSSQYFEQSLPSRASFKPGQGKSRVQHQKHSRKQGSEAAFTLMRPLKERERVRRGAGGVAASEPGVRAEGCLLN